jgi:RNA polymerase sigma-70 factor (sigma-E family)
MATAPGGDSEAAFEGADDAVERLYAEHWTSLVRLGALLLRDQAAAEEVVQDAFIGMHRRWESIREQDKALAYLRRSVVNGSRSVHRRQVVARRFVPDREREVDSAEATVIAGARRAAVLSALDGLPRRQRDVLVLRHWLDLSEADIAATLRISRGAVKSHSSRGLKALRTTLEPDT